MLNTIFHSSILTHIIINNIKWRGTHYKGDNMEIVWTKSLDELKNTNFNKNDKIKFTCTKCHKLQSLTYKSVITRDYFICRACRGVETQLKIAAEDPNYGWFRNKKDADWIKSDYFKKKRAETMIERYGAAYTLQSKILREKKEKTSEEKYGDKNYTNREKCVETNLKRYGIKYAGFQDKASKLKSIETCQRKYGVNYTAQVPEIRAKQKRKYKINGICFDSMAEIYYYYWLKDNNIVFEYNKKYPKTYIGSDNKEHHYFYDFKIGDEYIEIKGDCFFNSDNKPVCTLYSYKYDWTDKYNFIVNEGIKVILSSRIERGDLKYIKDNFIQNHKDVRIER